MHDRNDEVQVHGNAREAPIIWKCLNPFLMDDCGRLSHKCHMRKGDVTCPDCSAGYRRIELETQKGTPGHYKCLVCDRVLEVFDGSREIAYRLTVQPTDLHLERS